MLLTLEISNYEFCKIEENPPEGQFALSKNSKNLPYKLT